MRSRKVALSRSVPSASYSPAITSEKYCVDGAGRNLGIWNSVIQWWNGTLSMQITSTRHSIAITSEKYCVILAGRNHGIWNSVIQWWNGTLFSPNSVRKPQHCHHFGEVPCDRRRQKPGYMKFRHPMVEWHILHANNFHTPQHCHHFGEVLCDFGRQKPGYMKFRHPMVEWCIVQPNSVRKPQHFHHFGQALCDFGRQKPGYMKFRHPMVEWRIVQTNSLRKPQHCHHFGEALCDWCRQETWVYEILSSNGGMAHCPNKFCPQATALPSLWRSTVWPFIFAGWLGQNGSHVYKFVGFHFWSTTQFWRNQFIIPMASSVCHHRSPWKLHNYMHIENNLMIFVQQITKFR